MEKEQESATVIENKLFATLSMVNDWLKFAEAKNTGLLTFCGGVGAAVATMLAASSGVSSEWRIGLLVSVFFLFLSCPITLISFFPQTNLWKRISKIKDDPCDDDNLFFFGHLYKYTPNKLVQAMANSYLADPRDKEFKPSKYHYDIAAQVVINAQIARTKYRLFSFALIVAMLALAAPTLLVLKGIYVAAFGGR